MKLVLRGAVVAAAFALAVGSANAACLTTSSQAGKVLAVSGNVLTSGAQGFVPLVKGQVLGQGAEVILGRESSATLAFGGKKLTLRANSTYRLDRQKGGDFCLARADAQEGVEVVPTQASGAGAAGAGGLASNAVLPVVLGAAALVAVGVTVAVASKKHHKSD